MKIVTPFLELINGNLISGKILSCSNCRNRI